MLTHLRVQNFRSCEDVEFSLGESLIALLGRNGAGKTNLLRAIELLTALGSGSGDWPELEAKDPGKPVLIGASIFLHDRLYYYEASRPAGSGPGTQERLEIDGTPICMRINGELRITVDRDSPFVTFNKVSSSAGLLTTAANLLPEETEILDSIRALLHTLSATRYYTLDDDLAEPTHANFVARSLYDSWRAIDPDKRATTNSVIFRLIDLSENHPQEFEELQSLLGSGGLGLVSAIFIRAITMPPLSNEGMPLPPSEGPSRHAFFVGFLPSRDIAGTGQYFSFDELSAGTRRLIRLLAHVVYDDSSILLLEQPEDCLHAGLISRLVGILRAYSHRCQFIFSTHSRDMLDVLYPNEVRLVESKEGHTHARGLSPRELECARRYLADSGPLSEFFESIEE